MSSIAVGQVANLPRMQVANLPRIGPNPRQVGNLPHVALLAVLLTLAGCRSDLETGYGRSEEASASVNGTSVLARMFQQAGDKPFVWRTLSPRLEERADCIVWFPNRSTSPTEETRKWLEHWLQAKPQRTLLVVLRDYDAAPAYWLAIRPEAPADQQAEISRRLQEAQLAAEWHALSPPLDADWFEVAKARTSGRASELWGDAQWTAGIDAARAEITVGHRLEPGADGDTVLGCEHGALLVRQAVGDSQLLVAANGSFLLNLPLVNREHRKLAARLIAACGPPGRKVAFLEPPWGEPRVRGQDPSEAPATGLEILTVWPSNWILLHLIAAGVIFCFSRWPIFGVPQQPEPEPASDMGKHVAALAEHLVVRSEHEGFALATVMRYKQPGQANDQGPMTDDQ